MPANPLQLVCQQRPECFVRFADFVTDTLDWFKSEQMDKVNQVGTCLVEDCSYEGQYVALRDLDNEVVGSGADADQAYNEALAHGCNDPVLVYVPTDKESTFVF